MSEWSRKRKKKRFFLWLCHFTCTNDWCFIELNKCGVTTKMSSDITVAHIHGLLENFSKNVYRAKDSEQGSIVSIKSIFAVCCSFLKWISNKQCKFKLINESKSYETYDGKVCVCVCATQLIMIESSKETLIVQCKCWFRWISLRSTCKLAMCI